jgi:hypothetical protein
MDVVALNWSPVPFAEALPSPWRTTYLLVLLFLEVAVEMIMKHVQVLQTVGHCSENMDI